MFTIQPVEGVVGLSGREEGGGIRASHCVGEGGPGELGSDHLTAEAHRE